MNAPATKYDGFNKYIRITDIDEASSKYLSNNPVSPDGELLDKYLVKFNDILFARTGASTGKTYIYNKLDGKLYFAGFLIRAKIKQEFNAPYLSGEEVMEYLHISPRTLQTLRDKRMICYTTIGGKILYPEEELIEVLHQNYRSPELPF